MWINYNNLLQALVYDYLIKSDEQLYDIFNKIDDNNNKNGLIPFELFKNVIKHCNVYGNVYNELIQLIDVHVQIR